MVFLLKSFFISFPPLFFFEKKGSIEINMEKTPIELHLQGKEEHPPTKPKNQKTSL